MIDNKLSKPIGIYQGEDTVDKCRQSVIEEDMNINNVVDDHFKQPYKTITRHCKIAILSYLN